MLKYSTLYSDWLKIFFSLIKLENTVLNWVPSTALKRISSLKGITSN